jgi:hypothetical protein
MPARVRCQLALQVPPELLARLQAAAVATGRTKTSLALEWLERGLAGHGAPPAGHGAPPELLARIEALEAGLAELQRQPSLPPPARPSAAPLPPPAELGAVGGDAIPSAELARRLGVKGGTLNARLQRLGGPMPGLIVDGWRCLGKRQSPQGGPPRAYWQPIEPPA